MQKIFFSKKSAAELLSISVRTLENLIATKQLHAKRIGSRVVISSQVLQEFARRDHATTKKASREVAK